MYREFALISGFIFAYGMVSNALEKTPVNGALVHMTFGLLCGKLALGWLPWTFADVEEGISLLAEMTLALSLYCDAANANLSELRYSYKLPLRLLLIGLPLIILGGVGAGIYLFKGQLDAFEIALLSIMLAPTDAALGKAVVTNVDVPPKIREGLNIESGLNEKVTGDSNARPLHSLRAYNRVGGLECCAPLAQPQPESRLDDPGWPLRVAGSDPVLAAASACPSSLCF